VKPENFKKYLTEKSQAEDGQDLVGRLLFYLLNLQGQKNRDGKAESGNEAKRHSEKVRYLHSMNLQNKISEKILGEIRDIVEEKEIDLSDVLSSLAEINNSLENGHAAVIDTIGEMIEKHPETLAKLDELAKAVKGTKPKEISFSKVIESQEAGYTVLGKLIVSLTEAVKDIEIPKKVEISKPIEVEKPRWWKEFTFSWEPLEKIFEKLKKWTFSVKVENQIDLKKFPKETAKEISDKLAEILPKIRSGNWGNIFNFDGEGNLKVSSEGDSTAYNYIQSDEDATYKYYGFASTDGWKFKRKTLATGVWEVASGTGDYDTAWADRENKDYDYT
jgi:hypothetical protein